MTESRTIAWSDLSSPDYRTPFFAFQPRVFGETLQHFQKFGTVYYPVKANDCVPVIREVLRAGGRFEVDSVPHVEKLIALGVSPKDIQFSIPIRRRSDTERAVRLGVRQYVVDSLEEVERLSIGARGLDLVVRLSIADILGLEDVAAWKWGTTSADFPKLERSISSHHHNLVGVSFYLPTHVYSSDSFGRVLHAISRQPSFDSLPVIDIGGGLDTAWDPSFSNQMEDLRKRFPAANIILEPGRNLLDTSFKMVTSVAGTADRGLHRWAYLDAGIYNGLLDGALLGSPFEFSLLGREQNEADSPRYEYLLSGPTSDHLDFLGKHAFERALEEGDRLVVQNCGAYTYALRTAFTGHVEMDIVEVI